MERYLGEYLAAVIGSVLGAILLILLCVFLGYVYYLCLIKLFRIRDESMGGFFYLALGLLVGWWVGSFSGCWLALSRYSKEDAYVTAILLAALQPLGFWWFWHMLMKGAGIQRLGFWLRIGFINVVLSLLARLLTNMLVILTQY
ncbi:MAG: hypothetical protein HC862_32295 [Scytonema sp. RU_4_4]|nr:hypothetical protein [Scytonema sp. RU_4_4]